jgi:hypothetical protein
MSDRRLEGAPEGAPGLADARQGAALRPRRRRRWARRLAIAALGATLAALLLWVAIHRIPWLGPALADAGRAILGPRAVAWIEDTAYDVEDRVNRIRYRNKRPRTFWEAPPPVVPARAPQAAAVPEFAPAPFAPPFTEVAAEGDGVWVPIAAASDAERGARMHKAVVHPDPRRGFAALAVVAIDLSAFDLHLVAGTEEPSSNTVKRDARPGLIPASHQDKLVAAFNGGFKATHGQYGMAIDGVTFLPARDLACTLVSYRQGGQAIATWSAVSHKESAMAFFRQTPPCLVENGEVHQQLRYEEFAKGWGATISGETVIRRSAAGIDKDGKVLFYGLGEAMTAQAIARGMKAAGAHAAAELDVNFSYPRFLFYRRPAADKPPEAFEAIIPDIDFQKVQYVVQPSVRDFFYLTRKPGKEVKAPRTRTRRG